MLFSLLVTRSCTVYPVMTVASPSGKWQALQEQEMCSDDNQLKTVVWVSTEKSVILGGKKWSAFQAVASQPTGAKGVYEPVRLRLEWLNDAELQISYQRGIELQHAESTEYGVRVFYKELPAFAR